MFTNHAWERPAGLSLRLLTKGLFELREHCLLGG
jgi:hypothetical protein